MLLAILVIFFGNTYVNVNHSENQLNHVKTVNISKVTFDNVDVYWCTSFGY